MFYRDTPLAEIKEALIERAGFCAEIEEYFKDYQGMTYGDALDRWVAEPNGDSTTDSWVLNNAALLGMDNSLEVNDVIVELLIVREITKAKILMLWRQMKNIPNVSTAAKYRLLTHLKGTLPKMEKPTDWSFVGHDNEVILG